MRAKDNSPFGLQPFFKKFVGTLKHRLIRVLFVPCSMESRNVRAGGVPSVDESRRILAGIQVLLQALLNPLVETCILPGVHFWDTPNGPIEISSHDMRPRSRKGVFFQAVTSQDEMMSFQKELAAPQGSYHSLYSVGKMNVVIPPCQKKLPGGQGSGMVSLCTEIRKPPRHVDHFDSWMLKNQTLFFSIVQDDHFRLLQESLPEKGFYGFP
jgi:hypothetical protein